MSAPRLNPQNVPMLQARKSPRTPGGPFADLSYFQQKAAEQWLWKFCQKWGNDLPGWRRAILIGTAKRLAKNPPKPNFGYSLRAYSGSNVVNLKYKRAGLPYPGIVAMHAALAWKRAGRPPLPSKQLPA